MSISEVYIMMASSSVVPTYVATMAGLWRVP